MTLLTEKGTFTKETSNVDGTDQTVNLSNGSLTPKVLWLWTDGSTANATYTEHYRVSYGFSDATNDGCVALVSQDNAGTAVAAGVIRDDAICVIFNTTTVTTIDAQADVVSFNAGNFVLNWAVSDANANIIHYMVVGGTDITNVIVVNRTVGTASAGSLDFTDVGFQGDFINLLYTDTTQLVNTVTQDFAIHNAAATSSTARWHTSNSVEHGPTTMDTYNGKEIAGNFISQYNSLNGSTEGSATFTDFLSNGIRINVVDVFNPTDPLSYLVIKGGLWDVGNGTAPASTGQQTINITADRDPEAVMFFSWGDTTTSSAGTAEAHARWGIGGADNSLNEGCISVHDTDGVGTSVNTKISLNTKIIRTHTANATAGSSTTLAEADIIDMDNTGNFIIDWTTTLNGMGYVYFVVSQAVAGGAADDGGYGAEVFNLVPMIIHS